MELHVSLGFRQTVLDQSPPDALSAGLWRNRDEQQQVGRDVSAHSGLQHAERPQKLFSAVGEHHESALPLLGHQGVVQGPFNVLQGVMIRFHRLVKKPAHGFMRGPSGEILFQHDLQIEKLIGKFVIWRQKIPFLSRDLFPAGRFTIMVIGIVFKEFTPKGVMTPENLTAVRHKLHRLAELSGSESRTAGFLADELAACGPDSLVTGLGGHGLAAVFNGREPGPTVLLRCDIDALPLPEQTGIAHPSDSPEVSHKCGHDGHMTMLLGLARELAESRPGNGRAVLLFQPAEETGAGARRVLDDPAFAPLRPDRVLGIHNLPGHPLGAVVLRKGPFASASRGLTISLSGASSHAAEPQAGRSPALAAATLVQALSSLPQVETGYGTAAKVTIVGIDVGGPAFGTSPGEGRVMATLRAFSDETIDRLAQRCSELVSGISAAHGLAFDLNWTEIFPATINDPHIIDLLALAAKGGGLEVTEPKAPFAWSEDFGHFTAVFPGALVGLGAGTGHPALHHPEYDFPDDLLPVGVAFWRQALDVLLSHSP